MNDSNVPSTHALLETQLFNKWKASPCVHLTALHPAHLTDLTQHASESQTSAHGVYVVPYIKTSSQYRIFVRFLANEFTFLRYSLDLTKFHCLSCRLSTHCKHYACVADGPSAESASHKRAKLQEKKQTLVDDIKENVDADGLLTPTGHSTNRFPVYSSSQKVILANRYDWVLSQLRSNSSWPAGITQVHAYILLGYCTVVVLFDQYVAMFNCSCVQLHRTDQPYRITDFESCRLKLGQSNAPQSCPSCGSSAFTSMETPAIFFTCDMFLAAVCVSHVCSRCNLQIRYVCECIELGHIGCGSSALVVLGGASSLRHSVSISLVFFVFVLWFLLAQL